MRGAIDMLNRFEFVWVLLLTLVTPAYAADAPGVTETEIKIGATFPFSGPASSLGNNGRGLMAYVQSINDRGGINGRKIKLITLDDAYSPPKAVEQTRRLVESDEVAFIFGTSGTQSNSAIVKYLNGRKIPHLFVVSGATKFTNTSDYPYTTTGLPSYNTEGKIYARYIKRTLPGAKIGILFQNDDMGKDFVESFKETFKDEFDKRILTSSYEVSDPTVDSRIVVLRSFGADALFIAGTPKFTAQAIRKAHEIDWKPLILINFISSSVSATLVPAGVENAVGVISGSFYKDPNDAKWNDDPAVLGYRAYFSKYLPGADIGDTIYLTGTQQGQILEQLLKQCGTDLSRENINRQAHNFKDIVLPTFLEGVRINTTATNAQAITQLKLRRWNGKVWEEFGELINGADTG
jgi:ABC-type branched-subunit amino acid transport system substrate-binding protein